MLLDGIITELTGVAEGGVHKDVLPRGYTLPAIVVHQYNASQDYDFNGPVELSEDSVQLDIYGKTPEERDVVVAEVLGLLDGFLGDLSGGLSVVACYRDRGPQNVPFLASLDKTGIGHRTSIGYRVVSKVVGA